MSDVFLSYATGDRDKAAKLAALFGQTWTVKWDAPPPSPSPHHARVAAKEIEGATAFVVLWSKAASKSLFLLETVKRASYLSTIVVLLEKIEMPPQIEYAAIFDLSEWDGSDPEAELRLPERPEMHGTARPLSNLRRLKPSPGGQHVRTEGYRSDWGVKLKDLLQTIHFIMKEAEDAAALTPAPPSSPVINSVGDVPPASRPETKDAVPTPAAPPPQPASGQTDSRPEGGARFSGVFISYRRNEAAAYARGLYDRLAARFGRGRVFLDVENIGWGDDFVEAITSAAESCVVMLALISRQWSRGAQAQLDDYVRLEVAKALGRKIRVIPILIQGASMPDPKDLSEDLSPLLRRNALTLSDTRWERDVEDLIKALESLLKD